MKLAKRVAVALVLLLSMPGVAQAISLSRTSVDLGAGRTSVNLGGVVTLRGTVHTHRICHHHCHPKPPGCRPTGCPPCHHHPHVTIFQDGVPAATVSTDASGRFSYRYAASSSSTWSAMFRGDRCHPHPDRDIVFASVSRVVTVAVTLNGAAVPHGLIRF